jgi:predicted protein tyrosine phosphatase
MYNRLWNCTNPHQGQYKKVLCVCSAGLLRSPTTAFVLSQEPYNFNTRAAGIDVGHALVPVDDVLITWADEILVMNQDQKDQVTQKYDIGNKPIYVLGIPDNYPYRHPELIARIKKSYAAVTGFKDPNEVLKTPEVTTGILNTTPTLW